MLSNTAIDHESVSYRFSNSKDHIVYNAALVQFLAETFDLDYTQRTSISFRDIEFSNIEDINVAIITLKKVDTKEEINTDENQAQDNS